MDTKVIIGRAVRIAVPDLGLSGVPAKVDTGADSSSIWVSDVIQKEDGIECVFFGPDSEYYTGKPVHIKDYTVTRVANSFGQKEMRYKVKLRVRIGGKLIRASFTLSDRSLKMYPILIGRKLLNGKFLVDVSTGDPLEDFEKARALKLEREIEVFIKSGGKL